MGMDTREVAAALGISTNRVIQVAHTLGVGRNNGYGYWFLDAEVEAIRNRPGARQSLQASRALRVLRCPRCEILTPNGLLCADCRFELAHGRYARAGELVGELS